MRTLLLTLHLVGVAGWLGGGLFSSVSLAALARTLGVKRVIALDAALGAKFFGSAVGLVALSGVALVLTSDAYGWGTTFVIIGLAVIVADGLLEGVVFGPRLKAMAAAPDVPLADYRRFMSWSSAIHLALVVFALWSMVARLGV